MKLSDMKSRCQICKYYRTIGYADGHASIGCMKASSDGIYPVDIVNMDECPRDHKKKRAVGVDPMEMLNALGVIFTMCCPNPGYIPLNELLKNAGVTVRKKYYHVAKALVELNILAVISRTAKGSRGIRVTYKWNLIEAGPPSLAMVDRINEHLAGLVAQSKVRANNANAARNPIKVRMLQVDEGKSICETCWMRDTPDCRSRLSAMGIDCKTVNVNSLRYEEDTTVG